MCVGCVGVWGIPHQIDQAETITIFFLFKYVIDGHKKWSTPILRFGEKIL